MPRLAFSNAALFDIRNLRAKSLSNFGEQTLKRYDALLQVALREVALNPLLLASIARPEWGSDVRTYHIKYSKSQVPKALGVVREPRHLILYRSFNPEVVGVGRILHEVMQAEFHLPDEYGDE